MAQVRMEKVIANASQIFTDAEKAQARSNIGAGTVNGAFKVLNQGSGESTSEISNIDVNEIDTSAEHSNKISFKDGQGTNLGTYWLLPSNFSGIPLVAGNGISQYTPPQIKRTSTDCSSNYYTAESSITYDWYYTGGATKNKAIQKISNLLPSKTYLIYYRVCLNSTRPEQCVCINQGDNTYSNGLTDQWFHYICESGNSTYPYQHNITYVVSVSEVNQCYISLVGDWSSQLARTRVQMLNHQCYVFEVS